MPALSDGFRSRRRWRLTLGGVTVLAAALLGRAPAGAAPPPPNPSDQQITAAQAAQNAAASQVGVMAARIAVVQGQLDRLTGDAQIAEQTLALALQRQQQAQDAAKAAKTEVSDAQVRVDQARARFTDFLRTTYMSSSVAGAGGALLTASDPNTLLQRLDLQGYVAGHQLDAIGQLDRATVGKSNADAAARGALNEQTQASAAAQSAQQQVLNALAQQQSQKTALDTRLVGDNQQLQTAQIALTGLSDQRAAYQAWQAQQAAIAAATAARLQAQQLAQQQAAATNHGGTTHAGGGGGAGGSSAGPAPTGGAWTPAKGQAAVDRVMGFIGMPYAFAAGNAHGPTYGVCEPGDAHNACHVFGFDCSGLTIYAWAPYLSMAHFAASQYSQVGGYHPSTDNLMPGDLVFWSDNGSISGIGHVAMYIGAGNVIQAPQSGDVIKITNVFRVESGLFGATRPLT